MFNDLSPAICSSFTEVFGIPGFMKLQFSHKEFFFKKIMLFKKVILISKKVLFQKSIVFSKRKY